VCWLRECEGASSKCKSDGSQPGTADGRREECGGFGGFDRGGAAQQSSRAAEQRSSSRGRTNGAGCRAQRVQ
jgi:hypothetical protein